MRFELLGCNPDHCSGSITPSSAECPDHNLRKFVFDKKKIITSMRITLSGPATEQTPTFNVAFARACNFEMGQFLKENNELKDFEIPNGESSLMLEGPGFPIRSQCIAVLTRFETGNAHADGLPRARNHLVAMETDGYQVTFEGCNALAPHERIDSCGNTHIVKNDARKRIVGGSALHQGEWPWLVSLQLSAADNDSHVCGASLIYPQWLLTAAHCIINTDYPGIDLLDTTNWRVVLGEHVQDREEGTEQKHTLDKIVTHPKYLLSSDDKVFYDIALLKLSRRAHMSEYVNTICIDPNYTAPDHSHCVTAGWGDIVEGAKTGVEIPHHASVQIIPNSVCAERHSATPEQKHLMGSLICASSQGRDSCQGDSGGPLACFHDGHWIQMGVVNSGTDCAGNPLSPGFYTRVTHFYDWMEDVINSN
ncbi:tryptase-like [Dreissena polymorpha]|nr:tryptase-like [Dreissena polymorpha]XP_052271974.1 tryptase-like [Dreissena polymorpha]